MILLTCDNCDKSLRLRDELAGKRIKCPDCGESLVVPRPGGKSPAVKPAASITPPPKAAKTKKPPVADDEDDDDRPRRKAKKGDAPGKPSALFFIVGLILAIAGLAASAACIYISVTTSRDVVGQKEHDRRTKAETREAFEKEVKKAEEWRAADQKIADKEELDRMASEIERLNGEIDEAQSTASRYTMLAVLSGVVFLIGVGLRGYHHIAMKSWMAEYHGVGKKRRGRHDDEDDEDEE
jgi:hypothetical protein